VTGVNALFADGSAHWISRDRFNADLAQSIGPVSQVNSAQDRLWDKLDRR
jgi:prepilin-type processing-associated H-X9-DG protein